MALWIYEKYIRPFYEVKGVGHTPGDTRSVSMNTFYHKKQACMWIRSWDLKISEILGLL